MWNPITFWAHGWSLIFSAPSRRQQRGPSSQCPLLQVMSSNTAWGGRLCSPFMGQWKRMDVGTLVLTSRLLMKWRLKVMACITWSTYIQMVMPCNSWPDNQSECWDSHYAQFHVCLFQCLSNLVSLSCPTPWDLGQSEPAATNAPVGSSVHWMGCIFSFGAGWGSSQSISFCCWPLYFFFWVLGRSSLDLTSQITTLLTFLPS
jgi:hypothetical protein